MLYAPEVLVAGADISSAKPALQKATAGSTSGTHILPQNLSENTNASDYIPLQN